MGKLMIRKLREDWTQNRGGQEAWKQFHDAFLVLWGATDSAGAAGHAWEWRGRGSVETCASERGRESGGTGLPTSVCAGLPRGLPYAGNHSLPPLFSRAGPPAGSQGLAALRRRSRHDV